MKRTHQFDGELLTIDEISKRVRCAPTTVRKHLLAGRVTSKQVMAYEPRAVQLRGALKGAAARKRLIDNDCKSQTRRGV